MAVAVASGWLVHAMPWRAITAERVLCRGPDGRSWAEASLCPNTPSHTNAAMKIAIRQNAKSPRGFMGESL